MEDTETRKHRISSSGESEKDRLLKEIMRENEDKPDEKRLSKRRAIRMQKKRESIQMKRQNEEYRAIERYNQREYMRMKRDSEKYKNVERNRQKDYMKKKRQNPVFREAERIIDREAKRLKRLDVSFRQEERENDRNNKGKARLNECRRYREQRMNTLQKQQDTLSEECEFTNEKIKIEPDFDYKPSSLESDIEVQMEKRKSVQSRRNHEIKYEAEFDETEEYMETLEKKTTAGQLRTKKAQTTHEILKMNIKREPGLEDETSYSKSSNKVPFKSKKRQSVDDNTDEDETYQDDADEVMEILEKKRMEEQLPSHKVHTLRELVIKLRHRVLPQHRIERACGSRVPTAEEKQEFKKLIHPENIKKGPFTVKEDRIIINNWKAFCEMHNWDFKDTKPFMYMRHNVGFYMAKWSERRKFVQFLADGLPCRTLYSVYHRFKNVYDNPKVRCKYSLHEDEYIIKHIEHNKNVDQTRMFADLAKVLNRTRASVWRRYRLLKQKRSAADCDSLVIA